MSRGKWKKILMGSVLMGQPHKAEGSKFALPWRDFQKSANSIYQLSNFSTLGLNDTEIMK